MVTERKVAQHPPSMVEVPTFGRGLVLIAGALNFGLGALPIAMSVMFLDWQESFATTRAVTAAVHSTSVGILFGGGVIAGYVVKKFGARLSFVLGTSLATVGMFLGAFATNIPFLLASVGILGGSGFCLIQLPCIPCCTRPFKTKQGIAIATVSTGGAVVNLLVPYLYDYLIQLYSWRGAFIIISGISLNSLVLELVLTSYISPAKSTQAAAPSPDAIRLLPAETETPPRNNEDGENIESPLRYDTITIVQNIEVENDNREDMELNAVTPENVYFVLNGDARKTQKSDEDFSNSKSEFQNNQDLQKTNDPETVVSYPTNDCSSEPNKSSLEESDFQISSLNGAVSRPNCAIDKNVVEARRCNHKDIHTIKSNCLNTYVDDLSLKNESGSTISKSDGPASKVNSASDIEVIDKNIHPNCGVLNHPETEKDSLAPHPSSGVISVDVQIETEDVTSGISLSRLSVAELKHSAWKFLFDPLTWAILTFLGLTLAGVFSISLLVMDIAANKGFPQHGLLLLLVGKLCGLVSKALSGLFGLCKNLPSFVLLAAAGFLGSVSLAMLGWVTDLGALLASMGFLSMSAGMTTAVFPKCFLDMPSVGPAAYPLALGMGNTVEGVLDFVFPVLIGHMVDVSGTYALPCSILSVVAFVCSCVLIFTYLKTKKLNSSLPQ